MELIRNIHWFIDMYYYRKRLMNRLHRIRYYRRFQRIKKHSIPILKFIISNCLFIAERIGNCVNNLFKTYTEPYSKEIRILNNIDNNKFLKERLDKWNNSRNSDPFEKYKSNKKEFFKKFTHVKYIGESCDYFKKNNFYEIVNIDVFDENVFITFKREKDFGTSSRKVNIESFCINANKVDNYFIAMIN